MNTSVQAIQLLVAPVVMISACGLLCLALYARMALVIARARVFNKERLELLARGETGNDLLRHRADVLELQVKQIIGRAGLVRNALVCLLGTILCMLACSLALGASLFGPAWFSVALCLFVAGVLIGLAGVGLAVWELLHALETVVLESAEIDPHESTQGQA